MWGACAGAATVGAGVGHPGMEGDILQTLEQAAMVTASASPASSMMMSAFMVVPPVRSSGAGDDQLHPRLIWNLVTTVSFDYGISSEGQVFTMDVGYAF